MPVFRGKYSYAIVFLNRRTDGTPSEVISYIHCQSLTIRNESFLLGGRCQWPWTSWVWTTWTAITSLTCTTTTTMALSPLRDGSRLTSTLQAVSIQSHVFLCRILLLTPGSVGVVMIRANINKGDSFFNNFIEPGRDAQPRGEGLIRDRGHVGEWIAKRKRWWWKKR